MEIAKHYIYISIGIGSKSSSSHLASSFRFDIIARIYLNLIGVYLSMVGDVLVNSKVFVVTSSMLSYVVSVSRMYS